MNCPICNDDMITIEVAPCYDCGHLAIEIDEMKKGEHEYYHYKIFDVDIVLCDFCDADFDSYEPRYFGLSDAHPQDYPFSENRTRIKKIETQKDDYCENCQHRLAFLRFLKTVRETNKNSKQIAGEQRETLTRFMRLSSDVMP